MRFGAGWGRASSAYRSRSGDYAAATLAHPCLRRSSAIAKPVASARLYVTALGLYEAPGSACYSGRTNLYKFQYTIDHG